MRRLRHASLAASYRSLHAIDGQDAEIASALAALAKHGDAAKLPRSIVVKHRGRKLVHGRGIRGSVRGPSRRTGASWAALASADATLACTPSTSPRPVRSSTRASVPAGAASSTWPPACLACCCALARARKAAQSMKSSACRSTITQCSRPGPRPAMAAMVAAACADVQFRGQCHHQVITAHPGPELNAIHERAPSGRTVPGGVWTRAAGYPARNPTLIPAAISVRVPP